MSLPRVVRHTTNTNHAIVLAWHNPISFPSDWAYPIQCVNIQTIIWCRCKKQYAACTQARCEQINYSARQPRQCSGNATTKTHVDYLRSGCEALQRVCNGIYQKENVRRRPLDHHGFGNRTARPSRAPAVVRYSHQCISHVRAVKRTRRATAT